MVSFRALVFNAFEDLLRRRVLYLLGFVGLLVVARAFYQLVYMRMAQNAGDTEMLTQIRGHFVLSMLGLMGFGGILLGAYLGAVALSGEIKSRTIVPVLSRPVGRMTFLVAKWAGTLAFLALFVGVGVVAALGMALYWGMTPSLVFALGIVELFLMAAVVSSVSLAMSSVVHPVIAGGGALVLFHLESLTSPLTANPNVLASYVASAGRYLAPARSPISFLEAGLLKGLAQPDYPLYVSVLVENAGYAIAFAVAGALVFTQRELKLR